jgi:hypothetical protein
MGMLNRDEWLERARLFVDMRMGLWEATDLEFIAGYVDGFKPVYVTPHERIDGESWFVWFIFPGVGKAARVVSQLLPGTYADHEGNVFEHDPAWTIAFGTVTRIGETPLLSADMFK